MKREKISRVATVLLIGCAAALALSVVFLCAWASSGFGDGYFPAFPLVR